MTQSIFVFFYRQLRMDLNETDSFSPNSTAADNSTESEIDCTQRFIDEIFVQLVFSLLYLIIFCIGVFGNVLVCYVVISKKDMHSVTNFFILNLAFSDILMCLFACFLYWVLKLGWLSTTSTTPCALVGFLLVVCRRGWEL